MVCIFDSSSAKPEAPLMDFLYWSRFRMRVIGSCVNRGSVNSEKKIRQNKQINFHICFCLYKVKSVSF